MSLPQIRQPARTAKRFLTAISPNQTRFRHPAANRAAANFQAPKFPTREDGVSAAASTEEQGKFLLAGRTRLKTALPRRNAPQLRQKPKSFIIQRFSGGETIPRQGGCNISRRAHFVCCEKQRYNPAFRHGLAKGHNCAEQIPVSAEGLPLESLFQSESCAPRRSFPLRNGLSSIFSRRTARIKKTVRQRRQRADKARKRKNYPDKRKNQWQFLLPILQAFSSLWQSVDFVSILTA